LQRELKDLQIANGFDVAAMADVQAVISGIILKEAYSKNILACHTREIVPWSVSCSGFATLNRTPALAKAGIMGYKSIGPNIRPVKYQNAISYSLDLTSKTAFAGRLPC
jgi:hypothetical protein